VSFFSSPEDSVFSVHRIGGAKAVETGYLLLGTGPDEILEYIVVPTKVAVAWRDATRRVLQNYRPGRQLSSVDWASLAAEADPAWAEENLGVPQQALVAPALTPVTAPAPNRPIRLAAGSSE
jgi:hypothetical protein